MLQELPNGVQLNYEKTGSGPNLITIHGNGSNHHDFDTLVEELSKHFTVYGVDSRGQGESSHQGEYVNYEQMAEDYALFMDALDLDDVTILGHSDGAIIGTLLGIQKNPALSHLVLLSLTINTVDTTDEVQGLIQQMAQAAPDNPLVELMLNEPNIPHEDLREIEVPALVVAGDQDVMTASEYEKIASYIPSSQLYIVPGANHMNFLLESDRLAPEILRFTSLTKAEIDRQNAGGVFGQNLQD